ncbi:TadE/TadG family type IV pilus assembly protein [Nocardiopsis ansamitocini]|uniref:TadE-like domain-containing protein n=1 Tax=Nocardiopsis ansamitocini TaxID=1670832 RepID=A0A9W6P659_9ACTN|nr:TadE family protein [Nocardiopsis ansamitocini]GLU47767.1 hypothetical protein Nans01_21180 [Nocardiopsis ansamitocini]
MSVDPPAPARPRPDGRNRWARRDDRGSQILEFATYLPLFLLMAVITLEVFISFVAVEQAENAARIGARVAEQQGPATALSAAEGALPTWMGAARVSTGYTEDGGVFSEVSIGVPVVFTIAALDYTVVRRVEMAV